MLKMPTTSLALGICTVLLMLSAIASAATVARARAADCHGKVCHPVQEYCSAFLEGCDQCANICDPQSHNYHADTCARECAEYSKMDPLKAEIHSIRSQQNIILILLIVLLALIAIRYAYRCIRWVRHKRYISLLLKKLKLRKQHDAQAHNGKDLGGTTIQNVMAVNADMDRGTSQIYSVTGAEGSVMTMTTPVSTRYPAENSTTPTTIAAEYSYDNEALAVTPVSDKPNSARAF